MAKILRKIQKIFGVNASTNEVGQFGSYAAGAPAYTKDPDVIQALSQYESGWVAATPNNSNPAVQDMNAVNYLFAYQLAYIMQSGVPEWNAQTTYYTGGFVSDGLGAIYASIINDNLNQPLSDITKWLKITGNIITDTFYTDGGWQNVNNVAQVIISVFTFIYPPQVTNGSAAYVAVPGSNSYYTWGLNNFGQLGVGDVISRSTPTYSLLLASPVMQISGGYNFVQMLLPGGAVIGMGDNTVGQLGTNTIVSRSSPGFVQGGFRFRNIGTSRQSSYGVSYDGLLYSWGYNANGELGLGDVTNRSTPALVNVFGVKWLQTVGGYSNGYALSAANDAYSWGKNDFGQLGSGTSVTPRSTPALVSGGIKFKMLSSAGASCFGLTNSDTIYSWGSNIAGELGLGDVISRSTPTLIPGAKKWKSICAGNSIAFAIDDTASLWSWGFNTNGQLGLGDTSWRSTPTLIPGGRTWARVMTIGQGNICDASLGVTTNGDVYTWGKNDKGQLGLGDNIPRSTPTLVPGIIASVVGEQLVNRLPFNVDPGGDYSITMFGRAVLFNNIPVYQNALGSIDQPVKLTLEYKV